MNNPTRPYRRGTAAGAPKSLYADIPLWDAIEALAKQGNRPLSRQVVMMLEQTLHNYDPEILATVRAARAAAGIPTD